MRDIWRWVLISTGLVACPCHFPITLPIVIGALGATGVGAVLADHSGWVYAAGWAYFVVAVAVGIIATRSFTGKRSMQRTTNSAPLRVERGNRRGTRALARAEGVGDAGSDRD